MRPTTSQGLRELRQRKEPGVVIAGKNGSVTIDGRRLRPEPSLRLRNHSPTGFAWGYGGSGPAQLALAILLDVTESEETALRHYMAFKFDHVARWSPWPSSFEVKVDVAAWVADREGVPRG